MKLTCAIIGTSHQQCAWGNPFYGLHIFRTIYSHVLGVMYQVGNDYTNYVVAIQHLWNDLYR